MAAAIQLTKEEIAVLDELSSPPPTFVTAYKPYSRMFHHGGIEVNGFRPPALPLTLNMDPDKY
jgi:hypothetical protein